jgi:hypothetical protein
VFAGRTCLGTSTSRGAKGPSKKKKENKGHKNNPGKKQPTDFPFFVCLAG